MTMQGSTESQNPPIESQNPPADPKILWGDTERGIERGVDASAPSNPALGAALPHASSAEHFLKPRSLKRGATDTLIEQFGIDVEDEGRSLSCYKEKRTLQNDQHDLLANDPEVDLEAQRVAIERFKKMKFDEDERMRQTRDMLEQDEPFLMI